MAPPGEEGGAGHLVTGAGEGADLPPPLLPEGPEPVHQQHRRGVRPRRVGRSLVGRGRRRHGARRIGHRGGLGVS